MTMTGNFDGSHAMPAGRQETSLNGQSETSSHDANMRVESRKATEKYRALLEKAGHKDEAAYISKAQRDLTDILTALEIKLKELIEARAFVIQDIAELVSLKADLMIECAMGATEPDDRITLGEIMSRVSKKHRIPVPEIISPRRQKSIVIARHEYFWLAKKLTTKSLPQIGKHCGNRDHTTVMNGIAQHEKRMGGYS